MIINQHRIFEMMRDPPKASKSYPQVSRLNFSAMRSAQFLLLSSSLFLLCECVPLEPGQPGGPWTDEEIGIVRQKVILERF